MRRYLSAMALLITVPLLAFGPAERIAPTHWAFIVGISDYINFEDVEGGDLPGAEHDARGVRDALVMRGWVPAENIRMLLNHDATRAAIEQGITGWLTENARPADNVTIVFAGHGSQMWDESGDEDDGLDETLAPADVLRNSTENDISDDTFNEWLQGLPTTNVVVWLDNCNSGTGTRDVTPFSRSRQLGRDVASVTKPASVSRRALPGQADQTGFDVGQARVLELAAAQPNQQAVDAFFPGENGSEPFHGGAFTTYMIQQLWRASSDATYEDVFMDAYEALKRNRFQQDPYISEDVAIKDLPLFFVEGGAGASADASLPITSVNGETVELGGGLALGITRGSVFQTQSGANLIVESVAQRTTTARVASGSVQVGGVARLVGYRFPVTPLLVNVSGIDSDAAATIEAALSEADGIRFVADEQSFSHLIVRRLGSHLRVVGSDGFVRHDSIDALAGGPAAVAAALRREAAAKRLADMENPAQQFRVDLKMADGRSAFGLGEYVSFHVTSERAGYVTLVDMGTDGTVAMLLPNGDQPSMRIEAGGTLTYPSEDSGVDLQVFDPIGRGMVRVFITEHPLDLSIPAGETYASGGEDFAARVGEAVRMAAGESAGAVRLDSWATASLVYDIHR